MAMRVEYINPFIESIDEFFTTMLKATVKRAAISVTRDMEVSGSIRALIGLSGKVRGTVVLTMNDDTAAGILKCLLGSDVPLDDDSIKDGVAETVNIIAGGAKAKFHINDGSAINLSLPTVIRGQQVRVDHPSNAIWLEVPFESSLGNFTLKVSFDGESSARAAAGE